jgi:signal transduction histidine kinase
VHFDPARWRPDSRLPIVAIKTIAADHQPLGEARVFGPRPQALEIGYLGVNLSAPKQVVYRYRLDGFDTAWQDVGDRTEAIYTRVPAGRYTFSVMASNGNGVWTAPVASAPFVVSPSFYQTPWFTAVCVCIGTAFVWLVYNSRLRTLTREIRARAEERADERVRIARDIHDTLLQAIQGLLLTVHVAAQKIAPDSESRSLLERALTTADQIILEGRNRVSGLRSEYLSDSELLASIENIAHDLESEPGPQCRVSRSGIRATLRGHVTDEIFYLAREALTNAFRHAKAAQISLDLVYGKRFFKMICKDNGCGFRPEQPHPTGHWGLKGMAERVRKLGGQFSCHSAPGSGTEIRVSLPSYLAYPRHSRLMFYLRALRIRDRPTA